jgi:hypothetical protein
VSPAQFVTALYEPLSTAVAELYVPVVLNVHVVPFAKSITIDPLSEFDDAIASEICAATVCAASLTVIVPPAVEPV